MTFRSIAAVLLGVSILFISSCNSSKKIIRAHDLKSLSASALRDSIVTNYGYCNPVSIRFSAAFTIPDKSVPSLSGLIKIKRDSLVWISVSAVLGIEVARLKLTPDSLFLINRLQSTYYAGSYAYARQLLHFDFDFRTLQALLLDEMFFYPPLRGDTVAAIDSMHVRSDGGVIQMKSIKRRELRRSQRSNPQSEMIQQIIEISKFNLRVESVKIKDLKNDRRVQIDYSDFNAEESLLPNFPRKINLAVDEAKNEYLAKIEYSRISTDSVMSFPFEIPAKYKKMPISQTEK